MGTGQEQQRYNVKPPTVALMAVRGMERWKKNVLFVVGVVGILALLTWFTFLDQGHEHPIQEWFVAGALILFCWWSISPEWTTRQMDKYAPSFLRKERRS